MKRAAPLLLCLALLFPSAGKAQEGKENFQEVTHASKAAVEKGLAALAQLQQTNGSFGGSVPVANTALAGLAFLAGGHTPYRGKYAPVVQKAARYILRCASREGYINEKNAAGARGQGDSTMHGHGYALLFLTQVYGMMNGSQNNDEEILKEAVSRGVRLTEAAQSKNGGWYYDPSPGQDESSVTITQVQALRAAKETGIAVNIQTVQKAIQYIEEVTTDSGGVAYTMSSKGTSSGNALTAAGMCVFTYLGEYKSPKIEKGLDSLLKNYLPGSNDNNPKKGAWSGWHYYGSYYATLAMYHKGGKYWQNWWPAMRKTLLDHQDASGLWKKGESVNYSPAFGTSLALLMLQIPHRYLPIFQRGRD